ADVWSIYMKIFEIILLIFIIIYGMIYLFLLSKTEKPLKFFGLKAVVMFILIAVINLTTFASGLHIPVNYCTIIGTSVGGVPFLGGVLMINSIFSL
ncbi:MAG: hypothetical protein KBS52_06240, partial [Clostridiales bacterium]|nr:hypothetical protein [Candidatus Equinaster intestinalis]